MQHTFDIIGDVHGCADELRDLFVDLGYVEDSPNTWRSPAGRLAIFIGDLADRGPKNAETLRTAMLMRGAGTALWVPGNHDAKLERLLAGEDVPLLYGLEQTMAELDRESPSFLRELLSCLQVLSGHHVLDEGRLIVAHTGLAEEFQGIESPETRHIAIYGCPIGGREVSDASLRHGWRHDYAGKAAVVFGHTPVCDPVWRNSSIDIDTGCVFGGKLTALRWPERELRSIDARRIYADPPRHFSPAARTT